MTAIGTQLRDLTGPMAVGGILYGRRQPRRKAGGILWWGSIISSLSVENEHADAGDGTAEPVSRDKILTRERGHFFPVHLTTSKIDNLNLTGLMHTRLKVMTLHTHTGTEYLVFNGWGVRVYASVVLESACCTVVYFPTDKHPAGAI